MLQAPIAKLIRQASPNPSTGLLACQSWSCRRVGTHAWGCRPSFARRRFPC